MNTNAAAAPAASSSSPRPGASPRPLVVTSTKSVGIQILLVFVFGPLGLFYSTVKGALLVIGAAFIVLPILAAIVGGVAGLHSSGLGLLGGFGIIALAVPFAYIASFIWGVAAVKAFNRELLQSAA